MNDGPEYCLRLKELISQRQVVAVLGAGVSHAIYKDPIVTWKGLLLNGIQYAARNCSVSDKGWKARYEGAVRAGGGQLETVGTELESRLVGTHLGDWLDASFRPLTIQDRSLLEAVNALRVPVATTNYDCVIGRETKRGEVTWMDDLHVYRWLGMEDQRVLHLHGIFDRPNTVVLGKGSYDRLGFDRRAQFVQQVIGTGKRLLFIGCGAGLEDSNVGALMAWLRDVYEQGAIRHYLLCLNKEKSAGGPFLRVPYGPNHEALAGFILKNLVPDPTAAEVSRAGWQPPIRGVAEKASEGLGSSLPQAILGEWLEIKSSLKSRRYALVTFEATEGRGLRIRGCSYDEEGSPYVRWPTGHEMIDVSGVGDGKIVHAYSATYIDGSAANLAHGLSVFRFPPEEKNLKGNGFYVAHSDATTLGSGRVDFQLRKLTPGYVRGLLGRPLRNDDDRRDLIRAVARFYDLRRVVITGGTYAGKTELVQHLASQKHQVVEEAAWLEIQERIAALGGREAFSAWKADNFRTFQRAVFRRQLKMERLHPARGGLLFMDRSGVDCIAYLAREGYRPDARMQAYASGTRLYAVFVLDTLPDFNPRLDTGRESTREASIEMRGRLLDAYRRYGHEPIFVPVGSREERAGFVLNAVGLAR